MARDDTLGVAGIGEILRLLPHRYPFLLIDRVINIRGDQHGIGIKNVFNQTPLFGLVRAARDSCFIEMASLEGRTVCVAVAYGQSVSRFVSSSEPPIQRGIR